MRLQPAEVTPNTVLMRPEKGFDTHTNLLILVRRKTSWQLTTK